MKNEIFETGGFFLCMVFTIFLIGMLAGISLVSICPERFGIEVVTEVTDDERDIL